MKIQCSYTPLKGSMPRDTRGIQKYNISYNQKKNNSQITSKMKKRTYLRPGSQSAEKTAIHQVQTLSGHPLLRGKGKTKKEKKITQI